MLCSRCPIQDSFGYLNSAVMLQASCHTSGRNRSKKVHISSHDGLRKLRNINLLQIGPSVSQKGSRIPRISPFPNQIFLE